MIKNLFFETVNMSITASVVILAVIALRWLFRKQPKVYSYILWSMVLFRLLCPFSFSLDTSAFNLLPAKQTATGQIEYAVPEIIVENIAPQQEETQVDIVVSPQISQSKTVQTQPENKPQQNVIVMAPQPKIDYIQILAILWIAGVFYMIADNLISLYEIKLILKNSENLYGNVYRSDAISTAFIIGVLKPTIYLPKNLTEQRQRYIIFHEETHLRRKDYLFKFIAFIALAIHWFNPLVWLAYNLAEKDMEMSCDEAVIKWIGSSEKRGYSQTLLSLTMPFKEYRTMHLAFGEGETKQRIVNILSFKKPRARYVVAIMMIMAVSATLLLTNPGLTNAKALLDGRQMDECVLVTADGYLALSGNIADTVTDSMEKTKLKETEQVTYNQGENYIFCTSEGESFTVNFNSDCTQLWLLDENSRLNGKVYDIAKPDSSTGIGGFVKNNVQHYAEMTETQQVKFPFSTSTHPNCTVCRQTEQFTVNVDLPRGWRFYSNHSVTEGSLVTGAIHNTIYLVDAFGETVGAMGFSIDKPQSDSALDLMNHINEIQGIVFDTNNMRVWPKYGESVFTTCSHGSGDYANYCVLSQKIGIKPYIMMCFIPEKVSREQAEIISASLEIQTADGGSVRASNQTFWIKPDESQEAIAQTAVSVYLKEMLSGGEYEIGDINISKAGENNGFVYPQQAFTGYDYVVRVAFSTTAPIFEQEKQFVNLIYLDKTSDTDFTVLGAVEHDASAEQQKNKGYAITENRVVKTMYGSTTLRNDNMTLGTYEIVDGEKGLNYEKVEYTYQNGVVVNEEIYESTVIKESKDQVVNMGTVWNGTVIQGGTGKIVWPTAAGYVSRGFVDQYPRHNGLDIAAPTGTHIYAADTGVVTKALYTNVGNGIYCEIEHGGYQTLYAHCNELFVEVGQSVQQGQLIAAVGSTGNSTGPHLHFEVKKGDTRYNPYDWF